MSNNLCIQNIIPQTLGDIEGFAHQMIENKAKLRQILDILFDIFIYV